VARDASSLYGKAAWRWRAGHCHRGIRDSVTTHQTYRQRRKPFALACAIFAAFWPAHCAHCLRGGIVTAIAATPRHRAASMALGMGIVCAPSTSPAAHRKRSSFRRRGIDGAFIARRGNKRQLSRGTRDGFIAVVRHFKTWRYRRRFNNIGRASGGRLVNDIFSISINGAT